jgi:hypothetical protein
MIRDDHVAKDALSLTEKAHGLLMESLALVRGKCSQEESKEFQAAMAQMEPIYREHPSLAPPDTPQQFLDSWKP